MQFEIERIARENSSGIRAAVAVTRQVWEAMEEKTWYVPDEEKGLCARLCAGEGLIYRAKEPAAGETAGVLIVLFPGGSPENLGYDAGFSGEELFHTAHVDSAAVLPAFRGCGLQRKLSETAERELSLRGYRRLMCTVHPDNRFSLDNMLRQGYRVVGSAEKYGGHPREILLKEL